MNVADEFGFNLTTARGDVAGLPLEDWSELTWLPGFVREDGRINTKTPGTVLKSGTIWLHEDDLEKAVKHGWKVAQFYESVTHGKLVKVER